MATRTLTGHRPGTAGVGSPRISASNQASKNSLNARLKTQPSLHVERQQLGALELLRLQPGNLESVELGFEADACYLLLSRIGSCELKLDSVQSMELPLVELSLTDGALAIINLQEEVQIRLRAGSELLALRFPENLLAEMAVEFGYLSHQQSPRFCQAPISPQVDAELHYLIQAIEKHPQPNAMNSNPARPDPAADQYARLLSLALFRHSDSHMGQIAQNRMPVDHRIEAIRHYVMRHIREDLAMEDLASLCKVSVKTLYNLFNREFGITPSAYIRELKLEAVHQCLKEDDSLLNVTQVALDFGFTNLGRFSGQYKQLFGESPSTTLKRHRAQMLLNSQTEARGYSKAG